MKTLGRTNQGGHIVELAAGEYDAMLKLAYALGYDSFMGNKEVPDIDYSKAFNAIEVYAKHRRVAQDLLEMSEAVLLKFDEVPGRYEPQAPGSPPWGKDDNL